MKQGISWKSETHEKKFTLKITKYRVSNKNNGIDFVKNRILIIVFNLKIQLFLIVAFPVFLVSEFMKHDGLFIYCLYSDRGLKGTSVSNTCQSGSLSL